VYNFDEEEFSTSFNGHTLNRLLAQLKPYRARVTLFLGAVLVLSLAEAYFTFLNKRIIDEAVTPGDAGVLGQLMLNYGILALIAIVAVFAFIFVAGTLGQQIEYDLRGKMFRHLQALSLSYFDKTPVGWIMARVTSDSERIADLITFGMLDVTWAAFNILMSLIFMAIINWQLMLLVFVTLPVLLALGVWFKAKILVHYRLSRKANSKITGQYNENITGVRVVKALSREDTNLKEFNTLTEEMYVSSFKAAVLSAMFLPAVQLISAIAVGIIVWYGGGQVSIGGITIGGIQAFVGYMTFMMWPIQDLARVYADMQHAVASAERIFALIDAVPAIQDKTDAVDPGTMRGDIEFDHVDFYYDPDKPVLKDFTLCIKQGESIAIVGPTGGGKSTIVNLICRFYEPKAGAIRIGGRDYTEFTMHAIQSKIGMVLQTPRLFSGSVRENIRYGRLDATDAEIEAAAQLAGAHEFIMTLDKGYEAEVGEGGNLLSVGQKQLISLARAVLAQPEIFIMDEATSSVDTLTEALIQRGMESLMEGRTSFVIAHRLSTIKRADRILVIEGGKIAEMGSHAELMHARGHYYRLYTQQFRRELEARLEATALIGQEERAAR
jgi:ATP-binding cassette subfamily B protein